MKLLKAMATVAGLTGLSRILGFIRDILTASILGAGTVADAFFVALKLPNFFRRVTAEGAFSVSFVPIYSEKLARKGQEKADNFASNALAVMLCILVPFTIIALVTMPWVIYVIAPGFAGDELRYPLAVELCRITFLYLLLMSLTALMGGIMNAVDRFAPFAFAPVLFNLCLIGSLLLLAPVLETPGHAMAFGVLGAGIVQLLWLFLNIKKAGINLRIRKPELTVDIKKLFRLMGPGVVGAGVMHINLFADLIIASMLPAGSISYLYYADRLNQLPLGMVGIAVGTALLPMLSKAIAGGDNEQAKNLFNRALEICLILTIPAAVALFVIPADLIEMLFERGAFSQADTAKTAMVLRGYAIGLPAYVCVKVVSTAYWAGHDTLSPVKVSIKTTLANIALSVALIFPFGVAGISISTGIMGWLQLLLLGRGLKKAGKAQTTRLDKRFIKIFPKIVLSSLVMGGFLYIFSMISPLDGVFNLLALVFGGMAVYGISMLASRAIKLSELRTYLKKGS